MRLQELFIHHSVSLRSDASAWTVRLVSADGRQVLAQVEQELEDALESVHQLALMMTDESEIVAEYVGTAEGRDAVRRELAARVLGEDAIVLPDPPSERQRIDDIALREWLEREMNW